MPELLEAPPEEMVPEQPTEQASEEVPPSNDELERTAEAVKGEDPRLAQYRQALLNARTELEPVVEPEDLKSILRQALENYIVSIRDMQTRKNDPFEVEIKNARGRLAELQQGLTGNRGDEESLHSLYTTHAALKRREIAEARESAVRRLGELADKSRAVYEERRTVAHNRLVGGIIAAYEKRGAPFPLVVKDIQQAFENLGYSGKVSEIEEALDKKSFQVNDAIANPKVMEKLRDLKGFGNIDALIDPLSVAFVRTILSDKEHVKKLNKTELESIKTKVGEYIAITASLFKQKLKKDAANSNNLAA